LKSDGQTEIPVGGCTDEGTVVFRADVNDPDGDRVKLQIELRRIDEYGGDFIPRFTQESDFANTNSQVNVPAYGLVNGDYHWQARTVDEHGLASEWRSFGNNAQSATDFSVKINSLPLAVFTYSPSSPEVGQEISFDASSSHDPDGGLITCRWDFGDYTSAEGIRVKHIYANTGSYTVTLTVRDDETTQSQYSINLNIFSKDLQNTIEEIINSAKDSFDEICIGPGGVGGVSRVAWITDFFNTERDETVNKLIIDLTTEIFKVLFPIFEVKQVSALSIADYIRLKEMYPHLAEYIDMIDTDGWITAVIAKDKLEELLETAGVELLDRLKPNNFSYSDTVVSDLIAKSSKRKNSLDELKNEVLNNIGSLSQEEVNIYKDDIKGRRLGNVFIRGNYYIETLTPETLWDIKINEEGMLEVAYKLFMSTGKAFLLRCGVPLKIVNSSSAFIDTLKKINELRINEQIAGIGVKVLTDGFASTDLISRNTHQALWNIKNRAIPPLVKGEIISIENFMTVWGKEEPVQYDKWPSLFKKDIFSKVIVKNEGNIKAKFKLETQYYAKFSSGFLSHKLPFIHAETKEIEPDQPETFYVWYKEGGEGIDPKDQLISFNLFGENNGTYGLDRDVRVFGTTKILLNDVDITEEELENAKVYSYPIRSELENISENDYNLNIYLENPFDFPIQPNLTQEIPLNVDIISAGGGTVLDENISWQLELEPEERKEIEITFAARGNPATIEIPAAMLKIYDRVTDNWLEFSSNDLSFKTMLQGDFDIDGDVDFVDYAVFARHWMEQNCAEPNWCEGADLNKSGSVDLFDLAEFAEHWLEGR